MLSAPNRLYETQSVVLTMRTSCSDFLTRQRDLPLAVAADFGFGSALGIRKDYYFAVAELLGHCWNRKALLPAAAGSAVTQTDLRLVADLTAHQKDLHLVAVGCW